VRVDARGITRSDRAMCVGGEVGLRTDRMSTARAVLIDVGGTLWPNAWPERDDDTQERESRLVGAIPSLDQAEARALVDALCAPVPPGDRQPTDDLVALAVDAVGPSTAVPHDAVVRAMCLPARGRVEPFDGARELLSGLCEQSFHVVVVSNVMWRSAVALRRDFEDLGLSEYVQDYVTSLDVGWRKPHTRFFDAALAATGARPDQCVMVGDSETNDIEPAAARGMLTIRVAIEEPLPTSSIAHHVCGSLRDVGDVLRDDRS
jgi:HAD superfamily hydrolase (TIGR01509 family)